MSRNVHKEEKKLLHILEQNVPEERIAQISKVKRKIFLSEVTYSVIERAQFFISDTINEFCLVLMEYEQKNYICMREKLFTEGALQIEDEMQDDEVLFGIGILLANNDVIHIKTTVSEYQIYDEFFAFDEEVEYKCGEILNIFDSYIVYEIFEEDFILKYREDVNRLLCALLIKSSFFKHGKDFADIAFDIFVLESSICIVPMFDTILQTQKSDIVFLQLYRCFEYLYIIQRAWDISEKYDIEIKNALEMLNNENIRYPEASSIKNLISSYCSKDIIDEYCNYLEAYTVVSIDKDGNKVKKVAEYIYNSRCKIAHYKYGQIKLDDEDTLYESNIILCKMVKEVYQKIDENIVELNEKLKSWEELSIKQHSKPSYNEDWGLMKI